MATDAPRPKFVPDEDDPQRAAVYAAQEAAMLACYGLEDALTDDVWSGPVLDEADDVLEPDSLAAFIADALTAAGWEVTTPPTVALDVPDDGDEAGWHEGSTGTIHLHPRLLDRWTVLHELAHWCRPPRSWEAGHGPQFAGVLVALVRVGISHVASAELLAQFQAAGVDVDALWAATSEGEG